MQKFAASIGMATSGAEDEFQGTGPALRTVEGSLYRQFKCPGAAPRSCRNSDPAHARG